MSNLINFEQFKQTKQHSNDFEHNYNKFLTHVNKFTGIPSSYSKALEVLYYTLRYLEGTVNAMSIMGLLNIPMSRTDLEEGKKTVITWLEEIIEDIKQL